MPYAWRGRLPYTDIPESYQRVLEDNLESDDEVQLESEAELEESVTESAEPEAVSESVGPEGLQESVSSMDISANPVGDAAAVVEQQQAGTQQGVAALNAGNAPAGPSVPAGVAPATVAGAAAMPTSTSISAVPADPPLLQLFRQIEAAGRVASFQPDQVTVFGLPAGVTDNVTGVPDAGGIYRLDGAGHPYLQPLTPPPPPPLPAGPSSVTVRLRGDEMVTFSGNKKEAETFMFLAKRLISERNLSVPEYAPRLFTDEARTWVVKLMQAYSLKGVELTWEILWQEFSTCYMFDRFPNWEVRQLLFSRKYVQKAKQTVAEYMSEFRHTVLFASDLSETDQVSWFLAGLVPEIAADCQTDSHNRPYTTLQALYEAARSVELRLIAQGRRQVHGAPSHLTTGISNPTANLHRPRNAVMKCKGPTKNVQGHKRPFPFVQRGGGRSGSGRGRGRLSAPTRDTEAPFAGRQPVSDELKAWFNWCNKYPGRCIRCGRHGHRKADCRVENSLDTPDQRKAFMEAHAAPAQPR